MKIKNNIKKMQPLSNEEIELLGELYQRMKQDKNLIKQFKTFQNLIEAYIKKEGYKILGIIEHKLKEKNGRN